MNFVEALFYLTVPGISEDESISLQFMLNLDFEQGVDVFPISNYSSTIFVFSWSDLVDEPLNSYAERIQQTVNGHIGRTVPHQVEIEKHNDPSTTRYNYEGGQHRFD